MYLCASRMDSVIFLLEFGTVPTVWYFWLCFSFYWPSYQQGGIPLAGLTPTYVCRGLLCVVTWMRYFYLIFLCQNKELRKHARRYEILHTFILGCSFITLEEPCNNQRPKCNITWLHATNHLYYYFWAVVLLFSKSRAIIKDLNVTLHGFMLQLIYTIIFRVQWLSNITVRVWLLNRLTRYMIWFIVFNATFINISAISWRPVLVVEEIGVPGETHRSWANNW